jgi:hypothetical protein
VWKSSEEHGGLIYDPAAYANWIDAEQRDHPGLKNYDPLSRQPVSDEDRRKLAAYLLARGTRRADGQWETYTDRLLRQRQTPNEQVPRRLVTRSLDSSRSNPPDTFINLELEPIQALISQHFGQPEQEWPKQEWIRNVMRTELTACDTNVRQAYSKTSIDVYWGPFNKVVKSIWATTGPADEQATKQVAAVKFSLPKDSDSCRLMKTESHSSFVTQFFVSLLEQHFLGEQVSGYFSTELVTALGAFRDERNDDELEAVHDGDKIIAFAQILADLFGSTANTPIYRESAPVMAAFGDSNQPDANRTDFLFVVPVTLLYNLIEPKRGVNYNDAGVLWEGLFQGLIDPENASIFLPSEWREPVFKTNMMNVPVGKQMKEITRREPTDGSGIAFSKMRNVLVNTVRGMIQSTSTRFTPRGSFQFAFRPGVWKSQQSRPAFEDSLWRSLNAEAFSAHGDVYELKSQDGSEVSYGLAKTDHVVLWRRPVLNSTSPTQPQWDSEYVKRLYDPDVPSGPELPAPPQVARDGDPREGV